MEGHSSSARRRLGKLVVPRNYRVAAASWLIIGLACMAIDDRIQPLLARFGAQGSSVRAVAEGWQQLGAAPGLIIYLASALLLTRTRRGSVFLRFAASAALAGLLAQVAKYLIGRVRPNVNGDATLYLGPGGVLHEGLSAPIDSMPSGHTAVAFSMAVALTHRWPNLRTLWFLLAAGVGFARTLVDRHFPSDVILGALLGTAVAVLTLRSLERDHATCG